MRSLQSFSRTDSKESAVVNIHDRLGDTVTILSHRLKACSGRPAIQLLEDYGSLPLVECYPGLLNQVFLNLLTNAVDAIEARMALPSHGYNALRPPQITIHTRLVSGQWIEVSIKDNGIGVSPSVATQIFNPFFTTKPAGQGTGMGLSLSYQIVQRHGGELRCLPSAALGSTFVVSLPVRLPARPVGYPAAGPACSPPEEDRAATPPPAVPLVSR